MPLRTWRSQYVVLKKMDETLVSLVAPICEALLSQVGWMSCLSHAFAWIGFRPDNVHIGISSPFSGLVFMGSQAALAPGGACL